MKPVTEDQVQSLLDGLEKREKEALRALAIDAEALPMSAGRMTGKILNFTSKRGRDVARADADVTEVVPLEAHRAKSRRRLTSRGLFCYVAGTRAPRTPA